MTYAREATLYPHVTIWLSTFLRGRIPRGSVDVRDTHDQPLNRYIRQHGLQSYFDGDLWQSYDIRVDITAFLRRGTRHGIAFVECKLRPVSLRDVAQLMGYSRVARPALSVLLSPGGIGDVVKTLLLTHDRTDILEYDWPHGRTTRSIALATWDATARQLDVASVLPPGALSGGSPLLP